MTIQSAAMTPNRLEDVYPQREIKEKPLSFSRVNVGRAERKLSLLGGAGLAIFGLSRRSLGGLVLAGVGAALVRRGVTGHCELNAALGIDTAASDDAADSEDYFESGIHVETAFTVNRPANELYAFWRNFENLPRFMTHLKAVKVLDAKKSQWTAKAPAGMSMQWEAEIINEVENETIAWKSSPGADVDNAGSIRFVPGPEGRGTAVRVVIDYIPPAGKVGSLLAKLFGEEPSIQIKEDLRRFKQLMETGEIATTQGQPRGTCNGSGERQSGW